MRSEREVYEDACDDDESDCWMCGGSGVMEDECDCGDDTCCCLEPNPPPCPECAINEALKLREERIAVLQSLDVESAVRWLKKCGRYRETMTPDDIRLNMHAGRVASSAFTPDERAASACWVEGLM